MTDKFSKLQKLDDLELESVTGGVGTPPDIEEPGKRDDTDLLKSPGLYIIPPTIIDVAPPELQIPTPDYEGLSSLYDEMQKVRDHALSEIQSQNEYLDHITGNEEGNSLAKAVHDAQLDMLNQIDTAGMQMIQNAKNVMSHSSLHHPGAVAKDMEAQLEMERVTGEHNQALRDSFHQTMKAAADALVQAHQSADDAMKRIQGYDTQSD